MNVKLRICFCLCALTIIMVLSACNELDAKNTPSTNGEIVTTITPKPTEAPQITPEATLTPQETVAPATVQPQQTVEPEPEETFSPDSYYNVDAFENRGFYFTLTDEERRIYEEYIKDFDISVFKDVEPISVGKIWIECGIEGIWQGEYALFSEKGLNITKVRYQEGHVADVLSTDISSRRAMADIVFEFLEDGVFEETGDDMGEITFSEFNGNEKKMRFVRNEDGIWMIKYNPFDPWE